MTDCRTSVSIDWLDRARKLEPMIQTYRDEAEHSRRMPRPLFEALRDAGFFRLWVPRRFGGPEVDMTTLLLVVEELSRVEGATGWNVMIGAEGSGLSAYLPEETARELIAPPHAVVAGSFQPKGEATPVEGGYRVSGRWPLASACAHATVVAGACRVVERSRARAAPDGTPELQVVLIPAAQCEVIDTWYSAGLRGTGSSDFKVRDAFVPDNRCFSLAQAVAAEPGSLYGAPIQVLFALPVAAVGLGIARAAIDAFTEVAAAKVRVGGSSALAVDGLVQATVGRAEAQLRSARAFVLTVAEEMTRSTVSEGQVSHETSTLPAGGRPGIRDCDRGRHDDLQGGGIERNLRGQPSGAMFSRCPHGHAAPLHEYLQLRDRRPSAPGRREGRLNDSEDLPFS